MKKIMCGLLAICVFFAFCSCQKKEDNSLFSTHLPISIGYWNIESMQNSNEEDALKTYIEKRFNITLEPVSVSWADYRDRYRILSATNTLPDVFASVETVTSGENIESNLSAMIRNKSIRMLPEDLSDFPKIEEVLRLTELQNNEASKYYLPRLSFTDISLSSSDAAMLVRSDWLDTLGLSMPQTLEEFTSMTEAFAKKDPDGNGEDDTIGYNVNSRAAIGKWVALGIAPKLNVFGWVEENERFIPSFFSEDYVKILKAYRELYKNGGLDPDFHLKKSVDAVDDFARGKLGALEFKSSPSSIAEVKFQWELHNNPSFEESVKLLNIFPAPDGNNYSNSSTVFWSETFFSSKVSDEKIHRILALIEFLLSHEGQMLTRYGIEGVDYIIEKNNKYVNLLEVGDQSLSKTLEEKYPSIALFGSLASWAGTESDFEPSEMNYVMFGKYAVDTSYAALEWNRNNTIQLERPYGFLLMQKESMAGYADENIINSVTKVIIGNEDVEDMWEEILSVYIDRGIEEYITAQNLKYYKMLQENKDAGGD